MHHIAIGTLRDPPPHVPIIKILPRLLVWTAPDGIDVPE